MLQSLEFIKDIGHICGEVRFAIQYDDGFPFIAVPIGKCFHIYSGIELKLMYISPIHDETITCIAADPKVIYTATKSKLRATNRETHTFTEIELDEEVHDMQAIRIGVMVAEGTQLCIYKSVDLSLLFAHDFEQEITSISHPESYPNNALVALQNQKVILWNIHRDIQIYEFSGFGSQVIAMKQSTKPEVYAFALANGRVVLHDFEHDKTLFTLSHSAPIADLSFRLDGPPQLAVGLNDGSIWLWKLSDRQVTATLPNCHLGAITSVSFIKQQNLLITAGTDNTINQWVIDPETANGFRLFRKRTGHSSPPVDVGFIELNGTTEIVSISQEATILTTNAENETDTMLLSKAPLNTKQMKNAIGFATTNASRFTSLASYNEDCSLVFLWDVENRRFGKRAMTAMPEHGPRLENDQKISYRAFHGNRKATAIFLTRCGNFGVVGTNEGTVELFNAQSARRRGTLEMQHHAPVVMVSVDALNKQVTSIAADGTVYFHDFNGMHFTSAADLPTPIVATAVHPNSQLIAVSAGESIIIFDSMSHNIARKFDVPSDHLVFSNDGRYLFAATNEGVISVLDVITGALIEQSQIDPIKAIAVHPKDNMVATIHHGSVTLRLWRFHPERVITAKSASEEITAANHIGLVHLSGKSQQFIDQLIHPQEDPLKYAKAQPRLPFFITADFLAGKTPIDENPVNLEKDISSLPTTHFAAALREKDSQKAFDVLLEMDPKDISFEISALDVTEDCDERQLFLDMIYDMLVKRENFDFLQAILTIFLNEFGMKIAENKSLKDSLRVIRDEQKKAIDFLETETPHAMYLVQMMSNIQ